MMMLEVSKKQGMHERREGNKREGEEKQNEQGGGSLFNLCMLNIKRVSRSKMEMETTIRLPLTLTLLRTYIRTLNVTTAVFAT
jgi:hypothetical protein